MSPDQIVHAWKDADFAADLDPTTAATVPPSPVGAIELSDSALDMAAGGEAASTEYVETLGCCQGFTQLGKCDVTAGYPWCTVFCFTILFTGDWLCPET